MHHQGMDQKHDWKQQLPYPYNQDLSGVLRHLDRRTPFSRAKLANDPSTAGYVAAAMRLVERHLGPSAERELADPDDANSIDRPLLQFLSQREVVAAVVGNPDPFPRRGSVAALRSTWRSQSDFVADVLSFALWAGQYPTRYTSEVADRAEKLLDGPDFVDAIQELAYFDMSTILGMPWFRLKLAAIAAAEDDSVISAALADVYRGPLDRWKQFYGAVLDARDLELRAGVTRDDLTDILASITEGLAMRTIGAPETRLIDHERRRSMLGTAALAVILGCVKRTDDATDLTLEQAVHALVYDRPGRRGNGLQPAGADQDG